MRNIPRMRCLTEEWAACFDPGSVSAGGLGGLCPGGCFLGSFALFAFDAVLTIFESFARMVGGSLVPVTRPDLALGKAVILHQRNVAGADVAACAALDTVEQAVFLRVGE